VLSRWLVGVISGPYLLYFSRPICVFPPATRSLVVSGGGNASSPFLFRSAPPRVSKHPIPPGLVYLRARELSPLLSQLAGASAFLTNFSLPAAFSTRLRIETCEVCLETGVWCPSLAEKPHQPSAFGTPSDPFFSEEFYAWSY